MSRLGVMSTMTCRPTPTQAIRTLEFTSSRRQLVNSPKWCIHRPWNAPNLQFTTSSSKVVNPWELSISLAHAISGGPSYLASVVWNLDAVMCCAVVCHHKYMKTSRCWPLRVRSSRLIPPSKPARHAFYSRWFRLMLLLCCSPGALFRQNQTAPPSPNCSI